MGQLDLPLDCWEVGDRLIELPGSPSQRCGVLVGWRPLAGISKSALAGVPDVLYPRCFADTARVVLWDSGVLAYSSLLLGLRRLQDEEQLSLLEWKDE